MSMTPNFQSMERTAGQKLPLRKVRFWRKADIRKFATWVKCHKPTLNDRRFGHNEHFMRIACKV
jgi:hypothetical protein